MLVRYVRPVLQFRSADPSITSPDITDFLLPDAWSPPLPMKPTLLTMSLRWLKRYRFMCAALGLILL